MSRVRVWVKFRVGESGILVIDIGIAKKALWAQMLGLGLGLGLEQFLSVDPGI